MRILYPPFPAQRPNIMPDPRYCTELFWEGPGFYAWRTPDCQRWYRVGKDKATQPDMTIFDPDLVGVTWADKPADLPHSYLENLTYD